LIRSFGDRGTADIFDGVDSRRARSACPPSIWRIARRKLDALHAARDLRDLAASLGNRLEQLSGDRAGQHSIRINRKFRVCFSWESGHAWKVEITDYH